MATLHEKYRPSQFADVIGQDRAIKCLTGMKARTGLGGKAYWIAGPSGTGKTTLARIIAADIADEWSTHEIDATGLSSAAIQDIERNLALRPLGDKGGHSIIINEAHGLNKAAMRQLLTTLERIPKNAVWIFTTTDDGLAIVPSRAAQCWTDSTRYRAPSMRGPDSWPIESANNAKIGKSKMTNAQITEKMMNAKIQAALAVAKLRNKPIAVATWDCGEDRKRGLIALENIDDEFDAFHGIVEAVCYPDNFVDLC